MFDTIEAMWAGLTGKLKDHPSRKVVWILIIAFAAGLASTVFAAWISYPSYFSLIDFIQHADVSALVFTSVIAGYMYFALAYVAGYLMEIWMHVPVVERDYNGLGFRVFLFTGLAVLAVDFTMNLNGAEERASQAAGEVMTYTYESPDDVVSRLQADRAKLREIEGGQVGGYGWRDPKTGIFHLNSSGKKAAREIRSSIRRTEQSDSTAQAAFIADQTTFNRNRNARETKIHQTLRGAVYGVYALVFLLCIVQAYAVESIQLAVKETEQATQPQHTHQAQPRAAATKPKQSWWKRMFGAPEQAPAPVVTANAPIGFKPPTPPSNSQDLTVGPSAMTVQPGPSGTVQNRTDGNRSDGFHRSSTVRTRTVSQKGYQIKCQNCGTVATMKSPRAKYCSPACKKEAWNKNNPDNQVRA